MTICRSSVTCRPACKSAFEGMPFDEVEKILHAAVMGLSAEELEEHGVSMGPPSKPDDFDTRTQSLMYLPF